MLTGTVTIDLSDGKADRLRHRVARLPDVPTGARVVITVGAIAVEPDVIRVLGLHERRLHIDVQGTPHAVRNWTAAIRTHMGEVLI